MKKNIWSRVLRKKGWLIKGSSVGWKMKKKIMRKNQSNKSSNLKMKKCNYLINSKNFNLKLKTLLEIKVIKLTNSPNHSAQKRKNLKLIRLNMKRNYQMPKPKSLIWKMSLKISWWNGKKKKLFLRNRLSKTKNG